MAHLRLVANVAISAILIANFACKESTSSNDSVTMDRALIGKWIEYDDTFTVSFGDGVIIRSDGKMYDLEWDGSEWIVDYHDLEGTFSYADKGTFRMTYTEEGTNVRIAGTYQIIENDFLIITVVEDGSESHIYYIRESAL